MKCVGKRSGGGHESLMTRLIAYKLTFVFASIDASNDFVCEFKNGNL